MVSALIWTRMGSWRQDKRDGGGSRRAAWLPSSGRRNHGRSRPGPRGAADAAIAAVATIVALVAAIEQFRTANSPAGVFVAPGPPVRAVAVGRCWAWR